MLIRSLFTDLSIDNGDVTTAAAMDGGSKTKTETGKAVVWWWRFGEEGNGGLSFKMRGKGWG